MYALSRQTSQQTLNKQQGAVLLVSLVLLLIMSIVAASSVHKASLEERMAANTQNGYRTFHAAETAIADTINDTILLNNAVTLGYSPTAPAYKTVSFPSNSAVSANAEVQYVENFPNVDNYSLGSEFAGIRFMVTGNSNMNHNNNIRSRNVQGFFRIVPSG